jgi:hypothetical protein
VRINVFENTFCLPPQNDKIPKFKPNQFYDRLAWHKLKRLQTIYLDHIEIAVTISIVNKYYSEWIIKVDVSKLDERI